MAQAKEIDRRKMLTSYTKWYDLIYREGYKAALEDLKKKTPMWVVARHHTTFPVNVLVKKGCGVDLRTQVEKGEAWMSPYSLADLPELKPKK